MVAYYNEIDPFAAAWLNQLIAAGHIAPGVVDTRSIEDVTPSDLEGFTQCHFFAGIGVWSYALRRAGWADDRPIWTGSCPCQPFSAAGKGNGFADERHLWPAFHWLIGECRPPIVLGEQVASKDGLTWLDLVQSDVEASGYAFGAADLCAAGFGAPHIRQRSFWMANAPSAGHERRRSSETSDGRDAARLEPAGLRTSLVVADSPSSRCERIGRGGAAQEQRVTELLEAGGMEHAPCDGREQRRPKPSGRGALPGRGAERLADDELQQRSLSASGRYDPNGRNEEPTAPAGFCGDQRPGPTNGHWQDVDWLGCRDGKWRPVEPGTFPLVNGATNRVGRLRGYGNAIVAPVAQGFIEAVMETL